MANIDHNQIFDIDATEWNSMTMTMKLAFLEYAIGRDTDVIAEWRQHCEDLADEITRFIALLERYGYEDGCIHWSDSHDDLIIEKLEQIYYSFEETNKSLGLCGSLGRFREIESLREMCELRRKQVALYRTEYVGAEQKLLIPKRIIAQYNRIFKSAIEMSELRIKCSAWTWCSIPWGPEHLLGFIGSCQLDHIGKQNNTLNENGKSNLASLHSVAEWKQIRSNLWHVSTILNWYIMQPMLDDNERGRPKKSHTEQLIDWAFSHELTVADLARLLVGFDLDPNDDKRPRTIPGRITRQKKILVTFLDNKNRAADRAAPSRSDPPKTND